MTASTDQKPPRYRLLLVDDEQDNLDSLTRLFRRECDTQTAMSGVEALELLRRQPFDIMLTDQRMPAMTGTQLCAHALELAPAMVRIIVTGHVDVDDLLHAINRGEIYRFVTKPWVADDLKLVVRRALESYQLTRENARLYEQVMRQNADLESLEGRLAQASQQLEARIVERSSELDLANQRLEGAIRELQRLATTDALTGLPNRRGLEAAATRELRRARHLGIPLSFVLLCVDGLHHYTERRRHTAGDELLTRIATTLREHVREVDLVARYGSDEFVVVFLETGVESARLPAERIQARLNGQMVNGGSGVTISTSVIGFPEDGEDLSALLGAAERVMREARTRGATAS